MNSLNLNLKSFLKIFLVSSVPLVAWSSSKPNNLKPSIKTFTILCIGLFIFGLGESILVVSQYGVTPWTVLAEGFAKKIDVGIGLSTFIFDIELSIPSTLPILVLLYFDVSSCPYVSDFKILIHLEHVGVFDLTISILLI